MPRYVFQWDYSSSYGQGVKGEKVDLDVLEAESINRDSPGVLILEDEIELQTIRLVSRQLQSPAHDRQAKPAKSRKEET